jgi:hypothetical protein
MTELQNVTKVAAKIKRFSRPRGKEVPPGPEISGKI